MEGFENKLPVYRATQSRDFPGFLVVWCQHEDCSSYEQRPFLVHARTWMKRIRRVARTNKQPYAISGRSCPYCFRVGRLPKRSEIG